MEAGVGVMENVGDVIGIWVCVDGED